MVLTSCSSGTAHSCGTVILYSPIFEASNVFFDTAGRLIMVYFKHNGSSFGIASVYAPNRNPDRDDSDFCIDKIDPVVPTLICGDFNIVFD